MLAYLENAGAAFEIPLLFVKKLRYCVISHVLPVMAPIFDLPVTPTSKSVHTSSAVLADLEKVHWAHVAFGISFLSCIKAEI